MIMQQTIQRQITKKYQRNPEIVDENTVIPQLPDKISLVEKPNLDFYKGLQQKNNVLLQEIVQKKKAIRAQRFKFDSKLSSTNPKQAQYQAQLREIEELKQKLAEIKQQKNQFNNSLQKLNNQSKSNSDKIKEYRTLLQGKASSLSQKVKKLEHRLQTAKITEEQDEKLRAEIEQLQGKIIQSDNSENTKTKIGQLEQRKNYLDAEIQKAKKEKDRAQGEFNMTKGQLDKKNELIGKLKGAVSNAEKNQKAGVKQRHDQEYETWNEDKKSRLSKIESEINKLKQSNKKIWEQYHEKQQVYWQQKQYIDFIEWQIRVKTKKIIEKQRLKQKQLNENIGKQRQKDYLKKRHAEQVKSVGFVYNYLNSLKSSVQVQQKKEGKVTQTDVHAKSTEDVQVKKKKATKETNKKEQDKKIKKKYQEVIVPQSVKTMFEKIKMLPPSTYEQIDQKMQQLREKQKEFDSEDRKIIEEIRMKQQKKQNNKTANKKA